MAGKFTVLRRAGATAVAAMALFAFAPAVAGASNANTALINGDSVTTGDGITNTSNEPISLEQFAAENAGFKVTVASGAEWKAMTAAEFAQYQVLIVGDPYCSNTAASANESSTTWAPVVMATAGLGTTVGNRTVAGVDPEYHYQSGATPSTPGEPATSGAEHLVQDGIAYAGGVPGATGVYYDTSCDDPGTDVETLERLTTAAPGQWTEANGHPSCGASVKQIASNPSFNSGPTPLTDANIEGWGCSAHISFLSYPADWTPLAITLPEPEEIKPTPTCGTDPETGESWCGQAYVLLAGTGIVATSPNLQLEPLQGEQLAGGTHSVTATVMTEKQEIPSVKSASRAAGVLIPAVDQEVHFALTGQNSGVAGTCSYKETGSPDPSCETDASGKVVFTYPDTRGVGADTINGSTTLNGSIQHATAAWNWFAAPPVIVPAPAPAPAPVATTRVLASKESVPAKGTARIASVHACIARSSYLATVRGSSIAYVTFKVNGHTIRTLRKPTSSNTFATRVSLRAGSAAHITMQVAFTAASKTPSKTFHQSVARCAAVHVTPRFTG
jgi:hypothetical protein